MSTIKLGRKCELLGIPEISDLKPGMNFRRPEYRREVFLRFYEFHLKYRAHAGAIYYALPYIYEKLNFTTEQRLLFAYINGCCQNVITTHLIFEKIGSLEELDMNKFTKWFRQNYEKFGWDTDRRYVKNKFEELIMAYIERVGSGTQEEMFNRVCRSTDKYENFRLLWDFIMNNFPYFGRLSTFSYIEYLKITGLNVDCDQLFLDDIAGSKSHRNGLCKVLGRDDLDWYKTTVKYTPEVIEWLTREGAILLEEARSRIDHPDLSYFTLETTLCCYKSWHRPDRRYPNVYNDMFHDRIKYAEKMWGKKLPFFWRMRAENLPKNLLLEYNPQDVGVNKLKQNHYLTTGQVIMMEQDWPCFVNKYQKRIKYVPNTTEQ